MTQFSSSHPLDFFVAVQDHPTTLYAELKQAQIETWASQGLNCLWYSGTTNSAWEWFNSQHEVLRWSRGWNKLLRIADMGLSVGLSRTSPTTVADSGRRELIVSFPDTFVTAGVKLIAALEYFLAESDCGYFVRTNSSSYLQPQLLARYLEASPQRGYYAGPLVRSGSDTFVSGSFITLSRDIALAIVQHKRHWPHWLLEDQALGKLVTRLGVAPCKTTSIELPRSEAVEALSSNELLTTFHYRCKSYDSNGQRLDPSIMRQLHSRIVEQSH
jgi:hypothetical protein